MSQQFFDCRKVRTYDHRPANAWRRSWNVKPWMPAWSTAARARAARKEW